MTYLIITIVAIIVIVMCVFMMVGYLPGSCNHDFGKWHISEGGVFELRHCGLCGHTQKRALR